MNEDELKTCLIRDYGHYSQRPLLPLLEYPFNKATELIAETYKSAGIVESAAHTFAYGEILVLAFQFEGSGYWAELAIDWLEQGAPINEQIAQAAQEMIQAKRATQKTRHRAIRVVRKWERERGCTPNDD